MFVSLQIGLQIVLREALVDFSEWILFVRVFVSQLKQRLQVVSLTMNMSLPMTCSKVGCSAAESPSAAPRLDGGVSSEIADFNEASLTTSVRFSEDIVVVLLFVLRVLHELAQLYVRLRTTEAPPAGRRARVRMPVRC
jgi:hypothetical protein